MILPAKCLHHPHRIVIVLMAIVGVFALINGVIAWSGSEPPVSVGGNQSYVPTTGDQGYPVLEFCQNNVGAQLTVGQTISPPDSKFIATYDLDRILNGVHEHITINVPPSQNVMPQGTFYDSANNSRDANVTRDAMACVLSKVTK